MKKPEEIADNCMAKCYSALVNLPVKRMQDLQADWGVAILAAINEAIQQERERTCEWVLDGHAVLQFFNTGCGVTRVTRHGKHCDQCGGLVVVKERKI